MTEITSTPRGSLFRALIAAVLVAGAMTTVLFYQIEQRAGILRDGAEVMLATEPVDPRDLLRGDYVILGYPISSIPVAEVEGSGPDVSGARRVWIRLAPGEGGLWSRTEASFAELAPRDGTVVVRSLPFEVRGYESVYRVNYGIERFYVPEGEGLAIENARNDSRVTIAVRVGDDGTAQVRALFVDGKAVYNDPLY